MDQLIKSKLWHSFSVEEVRQNFDTDIKAGLSEDEAIKRRKNFGENKLPKRKPLSKLRIFLDQFKSPLIYILIIAGAVVFALEKYPQNFIESSFIFIVIFINVVFGFWKEYKASKAFENLRKILKTKTTVIRQGRKKEVFQEELALGDIIILSSGDKVPADGRIVESEHLKISEAALTGEWTPAVKTNKILPEEISLADRDNMVYAGCLVENGKAKVIVTGIGENTEIGKISLLIKETKEEKTPLQKKTINFSKKIGIFIGLMCFLIFIGGIIRDQPFVEMLETSIAIAVAGIPEALPVVMTLILAIGSERLLRKKGLIRNLSSVETLGSTSVICCDKTKTLTHGIMTADIIRTFENTFNIDSKIKDKVYNLALKIAVLTNQGFIENFDKPVEQYQAKGTATDKALLLAGEKNGIFKHQIEKEYPVVQALSFNSHLRYQAHLRKIGNEFFIYIAGSPEKILKMSKTIELSTGKELLDLEKKKQLDQSFQYFTQKGLRVIALAYKKIIPEHKDKEIQELCRDITIVGFIGLKDPLRKNVKSVISTAVDAGLLPVIITGDHSNTAKAIVEELGIKVGSENIIQGQDLDKMSDQELQKIIKRIKIYARTEPRQKIRIVSAWQKTGEIVAMVGDGVNDAPALKKADIGVSLGSGTEVAKETSDLILLNDGFDIIVCAIKQGRIVLDNLRKTIAYVLADSFTSVILIGMSIMLGWPLPILWPQLLWNNIVEDTLPVIAFAFEPAEKGIMKRNPYSSKAPLLTKEMKILIFGTGLIDEFIILFFFWVLWFYLGMDIDYVRTMVFGAICIDTAFVVYCYKSLRTNIWNTNVFSNKFLLLSSVLVFVGFAAAVYVPFFQNLLHTKSLGIVSWLILIGIGIISMFLIEITKWYFISRRQI